MYIQPATTSSSNINGNNNNIIVFGSRIWFANFYRHNKLLLYGIGLSLGVAGIGVYLWNQKRNIKRQHREPEVLYRAEIRKGDGIEAYKNLRYEEAIKIFSDVVQMLEHSAQEQRLLHSNKKYSEIIASCHNNMAACYDALKNPILCLEHCNAALKINPLYVKALIKRAKCLHRINRNMDSLEDYFDLISMDNSASGGFQPKQLTQLQNETDKVADSIIKPELEAILQSRIGKPQRISQTLVTSWQFNSVINDPLLIRAGTFDENTVENTAAPLDIALRALKQCQYDKIVSLSIPIVKDKEVEPLERAHAVLLASRFLYYQGMNVEARAMSDCYDGFWDQLDEAKKLAHKDLHVAHIVLQMQLCRPIAQEGMEEQQEMNETMKQRITQLSEEALRINPKNVDSLVTLGMLLMTAECLEEALKVFQQAKNLHKEHSLVKYYEIYTKFLLALQQQHMGQVNNAIVELERLLKNTEKPPIFSLLMMAKIGMMMGNNEIALESVKKAVHIMPNCSYAIYLTGILDQESGEMTSPERIGTYFVNLEKAMRKSLEMDSNYWEPYRMLAKIRMNKHEFDEAEQLYTQAAELARSRDELMVLLKERLMVRVAAERKRKNKRLPKGMA